jgi:hypothetical protein
VFQQYFRSRESHHIRTHVPQHVRALCSNMCQKIICGIHTTHCAAAIFPLSISTQLQNNNVEKSNRWDFTFIILYVCTVCCCTHCWKFLCARDKMLERWCENFLVACSMFQHTYTRVQIKHGRPFMDNSCLFHINTIAWGVRTEMMK